MMDTKVFSEIVNDFKKAKEDFANRVNETLMELLKRLPGNNLISIRGSQPWADGDTTYFQIDVCINDDEADYGMTGPYEEALEEFLEEIGDEGFGLTNEEIKDFRKAIDVADDAFDFLGLNGQEWIYKCRNGQVTREEHDYDYD
jgi:hypothetical protein